MNPQKQTCLILMLCAFLAVPALAENSPSDPASRARQIEAVAEQAAAAPENDDPLSGDEALDLDFENPDVYIDMSEAIRSKQYVRRAILSSVIETTSQFNFARPYFNHLMGFSAIFHRTRFAKYTSGMQGVSAGYVTENGHGFEGGIEISAVSNVFAGYRYFFRPAHFSLWPFVGGGAGMEVSAAAFSDPPPEAQNYTGMKSFGFGTIGLMIPLVDVGIKIELRGNFYGLDRLILTQGIGAVIFL